MKRSILFAGAMSMLFISGCCAVFTGTTEKIQIKSTPEHAAIVNAKNQTIGHTPAELTLDRGDRQILQVVKTGYCKEPVQLTRKIQWWPFVANIIVAPFVVDIVTGAMWENPVKVYNVSLIKEEKL